MAGVGIVTYRRHCLLSLVVSAIWGKGGALALDFLALYLWPLQSGDHSQASQPWAGSSSRAVHTCIENANCRNRMEMSRCQDWKWLYSDTTRGFNGKKSPPLCFSGSHTLYACVLSHFSRVWLFVTPWTVTHQAPLSMGFSRQEYWNGLPCPLPRDLPDPGIKPWSPASQADSLQLSHQGSPHIQSVKVKVAQSCPTLCGPMDYTVRGILQARMLEW